VPRRRLLGHADGVRPLRIRSFDLGLSLKMAPRVQIHAPAFMYNAQACIMRLRYVAGPSPADHAGCGRIGLKIRLRHYRRQWPGRGHLPPASVVAGSWSALEPDCHTLKQGKGPHDALLSQFVDNWRDAQFRAAQKSLSAQRSAQVYAPQVNHRYPLHPFRREPS
jgi:hypothetical protein